MSNHAYQIASMAESLGFYARIFPNNVAIKHLCLAAMIMEVGDIKQIF